MDLRTALIALLVVLCIYLAWLVFRWRRVQRTGRKTGAHDDRHASVFRDVDRFGAIPVGGRAAEIHTYQSDDGPVGMTVDTDDDDAVVSLSSHANLPDDEARAPVRASRPSEPDASGFGFDALLEVRQMRHLIDELRVQQGRLADDVARQREELSALRAASRVAPAYAEAVAMVQRGLDAQAIAERCGISVAEAELVRALSDRSAQVASRPGNEAAEHEHGFDQEQEQNGHQDQGRRHE